MPAQHKELLLLDLIASGMFEIDDEGCIWRLKVFGRWGIRDIARRRAEYRTDKGYFRVHSQGLSCFAHRIVWAQAHGPIGEDLTLNHKNGIRTDNRLINLEAITQRDNVRHSVRTLRSHSCLRTGEKSSRARLTWSAVRAIRTRRAQGERQQSLADSFGVSQSRISAVCLNQAWKEKCK